MGWLGICQKVYSKISGFRLNYLLLSLLNKLHTSESVRDIMVSHLFILWHIWIFIFCDLWIFPVQSNNVCIYVYLHVLFAFATSSFPTAAQSASVSLLPSPRWWLSYFTVRRDFTSSTWRHRVFFREPPGETFDWLPVTSSPARTWDSTEGSSSDGERQRSPARPRPPQGRTSLYRRSAFNINEVAHWLRRASIPLRNFCRLADFLQYYFWGEQG